MITAYSFLKQKTEIKIGLREASFFRINNLCTKKNISPESHPASSG